MDSILQKVLKRVTPSKMGMKKVNEVINISKSMVEKKIKQKGINAEVFVGGSIAKGTWIKGHHDIDFFVRFNEKYKKEDIGSILKKIIESSFRNCVVLHGSRDYCKVMYKGYELEFIPVIEIQSPAQAENSMDASLFHVDYVRKKIKENPSLADEIRLFKAFSKAQGIYGAETHISGISGYVTELMMIHYKSFKNLVKMSEKIKPPIFIDIEHHYQNEKEIRQVLSKPKLKSPIVLIDPVLKERNACASLTYKTFSHLLLSLRLFSRKHSISFFNEKKLTLEDIKQKSIKRGTVLVHKKIKKTYPKEDVFLAKLKKKLERISAEIKKEGINIYDYGYIVKGNYILIYFELETIKLSKMKKHYGPPVWINKEHFDAFINKWKNVYVENNNLACDVKRKETNVKKIVSKILSKGIKDV